MSSGSSGTAAVHVQRGFHLPAASASATSTSIGAPFGINPSMLSGIPEVITDGESSGNRNEKSSKSSKSSRRKREASEGPAAGPSAETSKPTHFVIPHIRSNSYSHPHSHSRSYSQSWADGLENLHPAKNNGDDFADALLQSFINTDPTPTNSAASSNAELHFHHSPHVPLSPTAPVPLTFDIGRPNFSSFHGYQPGTSINSTSSSNVNTNNNTSKMAYSLPPEFLRHHTAPGAPFGNSVPSSSIDVLHSPSGGGGASSFDSNSLFLNLGLAHYPASNSSSGPKSVTGSRPSSVKNGPSPDEGGSGGSGSAPPSNSGRNTASPAQQDDIMLVANLAANVKQHQQQQQPQQLPARGRAASTGKAPPARQSRSRQRAPGYARAVSPNAMKASASSSTSNTGSTSAQSSNTLSASNNGKNKTVTSPYVTGYPSPSVNVQVNINGQYGVSLPTYTSFGNTWSLSTDSSSAFGNISNQKNTSSNSGFGFNTSFSSSGSHQRRQSDASTFAPSSFGQSPLLQMNNAPLPLLQEDDDNNTSNNILASPATVATSFDSVAPKSFSAKKGVGTAESAAIKAATVKVEAKKPPSIDEEEEEDKPRLPEDKRRKRRESHNAVERRRRDNINERITELASLIPQVLLDPMGSSSSALDASPIIGIEGSPALLGAEVLAGSPPLGSSSLPPNSAAQQPPINKPNKGVILSKSVEYIRYLQQMVQIQMERNRELEGKLKEAGTASSSKSKKPKQEPNEHSGFATNNANNMHDDLSYGLATVDEMFMDEDMRDNLQRDTMSFEDFLGVHSNSPGAMANAFDEDMS